jgi:hypothetical protein
MHNVAQRKEARFTSSWFDQVCAPVKKEVRAVERTTLENMQEIVIGLNKAVTP